MLSFTSKVMNFTGLKNFGVSNFSGFNVSEATFFGAEFFGGLEFLGGLIFLVSKYKFFTGEKNFGGI